MQVLTIITRYFPQIFIGTLRRKHFVQNSRYPSYVHIFWFHKLLDIRERSASRTLSVTPIILNSFLFASPLRFIKNFKPAKGQSQHFCQNNQNYSSEKKVFFMETVKALPFMYRKFQSQKDMVGKTLGYRKKLAWQTHTHWKERRNMLSLNHKVFLRRSMVSWKISNCVCFWGYFLLHKKIHFSKAKNIYKLTALHEKIFIPLGVKNKYTLLLCIYTPNAVHIKAY